jgi:hypothetical protein
VSSQLFSNIVALNSQLAGGDKNKTPRRRRLFASITIQQTFDHRNDEGCGLPRARNGIANHILSQ